MSSVERHMVTEMAGVTKRNRRKSLRTLRRQSINLVAGSDDTVPVCEGEYGSVWIEMEDTVTSRKHRRRELPACTIDWSPIEFPRYPVKELSPKDMTPHKMFTEIKSLERRESGQIEDHIQQHSGQSLNDAFVCDVTGVLPDSGSFYKTILSSSSSPYEALVNKLSTSSENVGFQSRDGSPTFSPLTPDIYNIENILNELVNGISEDTRNISCELSSDVSCNVGEPMGRDKLYETSVTQQPPLCDSKEMDDDSNMIQQSGSHTVKRPTHDINSGDGDHPVQVRMDISGDQITTADLIGKCGVFGISCVGFSPPQIQQLGDTQAVSYDSDKTCIGTHIESFVDKECGTKCNSSNIGYESVAVIGDSDDSNSKENPVDKIFLTPKTAKTPKQLLVKRSDSDASNETKVKKISKEKKNRRKSNFFFEGLSAPLPNKSKDAAEVAVESMMDIYCSQDEKENRCDDSLNGNLPFLCPVSKTIDEVHHDGCVIEREIQPESITTVKQKRRRRSACLNIVKENYLHDLTNDETDRVFSNNNSVDSVFDKESKLDLSQQSSVRKLRKRRSLNIVTENEKSDDLNSNENNCCISDIDHSKKLDLKEQPYPKRTRNRRKSIDFSCGAEVPCYTRTRSCRRSLEISKLLMSETDDSIKNDDSTKNANLQSVAQDCTTTAKQEKDRQCQKKDENLEIIYRNKNFKMPTRKGWETIYEEPRDGTHTSKKKLHRILQFENITVAKKNRRKLKAAKLGWDVNRKFDLTDDYVMSVINTVAQDLDSSDCL